MQNNIFKETVKIRYSEMDCDKVLKPSAFLQFLQDLASDNAEALNFGYSFIIKKNLAWFLLKYHIEFDEYPHGLYELTIKTEPRGCNKLFAYRDFEIFSGEKKIAAASTTWALVDLESKGMTVVADALDGNPYMLGHEKRETDLVYGKVRPPQRHDIEHIFEVRYDDLDVNQHVNNANYIVWAFEPLSFEFRHSKVLKTLDMVFKKEVKYGSRILSVTEINENTTTHILKDADTQEDFCMINAQWAEK